MAAGRTWPGSKYTGGPWPARTPPASNTRLVQRLPEVRARLTSYADTVGSKGLAGGIGQAVGNEGAVEHVDGARPGDTIDRLEGDSDRKVGGNSREQQRRDHLIATEIPGCQGRAEAVAGGRVAQAEDIVLVPDLRSPLGGQ